MLKLYCFFFKMDNQSEFDVCSCKVRRTTAIQCFWNQGCSTTCETYGNVVLQKRHLTMKDCNTFHC